MGNAFSRSLAEACVSGDLQHLDDLLLSADAKTLRAVDADGWTPLHFAAAAGDGASVALLLSHEEESLKAVRRRAKDGSTPLHLAASSGSAGAVSELLKAGADADALDGRGRSPLAVASAAGGRAAAAAEGKGAESSTGSASSSGAVVSALVAAGADAKRALPDGTTPLHLAAVTGNASAVAALLAAAPGASSSYCMTRAPKSLRTPLHEAAASGSAECARLLLRAGADPRAQDAKGKTPASVALDSGNGKLAVELAEGIKSSTGAGWWSGVNKEKTSYPTLHGSSVSSPSPYAMQALVPRQHQQQQQHQKQKSTAQLALEKEWGGGAEASSSSSVVEKLRTAAMAAAAEAAFGGWADSALAPPPPPVASRVAAALAALSATAADAALGAAGASRAAAASAASAAASATQAAATAAASARASLKAAAAARAEESVEGVATAPMGAVKSVYEVDAQLRATFAERKEKEKKKVVEEEKKKEEEVRDDEEAPVVVVAPPPAPVAVPVAAPPPLLPALDFGTLALATHGFGEASKLGGSTRGVTFAGVLPDGTKVAVKVLDPASAPPGSSLAGLLLKATGGFEQASSSSSSSESRGVLDKPLAVGPSSRAVVSRLAEGGSLDGALRGAPLPSFSSSSSPSAPLPPPRLSWTDRLDLLSQVSEVLSGLHVKGMAHGSVSAKNVLLDPVTATKDKNKFRARVSDAGVASLMSSTSSSSPATSSAAGDNAALGTMVLQALCGAEAQGLAASVARAMNSGEDGGRRSASSLAEKGLMEIGATEGQKKKKKKNKKEDESSDLVPGASRAVALALELVEGRLSAAEAARLLSELAEAVRSGEALKEEEEEEAKAKAAAAAVERDEVEQTSSSAPAPILDDDYEDVAGELSALEVELAALPSAPAARKRAEEKVLAAV